MAWPQQNFGNMGSYPNQYNTTANYSTMGNPTQSWPNQGGYDNSSTAAWPPGYTGQGNSSQQSAWPPGYQPPNSAYDSGNGYNNSNSFSSTTSYGGSAGYNSGGGTYNAGTNYGTGGYSSPVSTNPYQAPHTPTPPPQPQYDPAWPPGMGPNANFPVAPVGITPVTTAPTGYMNSNPQMYPQMMTPTPMMTAPTPVVGPTISVSPMMAQAVGMIHNQQQQQMMQPPIVNPTPMVPNTIVAGPMNPVGMMQPQPAMTQPNLMAPSPPGMQRKMSSVQEALLRQMAEEEARKQALQEQAIKQREEEIQRRKTQMNLVVQPGAASSGSLLSPAMTSDETQKLMQENAARQRQLQQRASALFEEEQMLEAMRRSAEDEKQRREALRRQQEAEADALRRQQEEIERKEREIAEKKRKVDAVIQDAMSAEEKLKEAQKFREQQEKELSRQKEREELQRKEQAELQQSFYSSLVDASKLVALNSNRLFNLIDQQYAEVTTANSPTAAFFGDVQKLLDRTTQRLLGLLDENVLNLDANLYSSITSASMDVRTSAQALLGAAQKYTSNSPDIASMSPEQRSQQVRHHHVALNFSIKTLLEELEALKIAESTSAESVGVMQAQSVKEAATIVDRQLEVQSSRRESVADPGLQRKETMARFRPTKPVSMSSAQLAAYDKPCIRKLQKSIRKLVLKIKIRNLARTAMSHPATHQTRHRNKLLREIVESEASYLQSVETALQYFLPAMQTAASVPGSPIQIKDIHGIFGSLDLIHALNSEILQKMRARLAQWPKTQLFADILIQYIPRLTIYTEYVNNFDEANLIYKRLIAHKSFQDLMKSCMDKAKSRLDLPSLLIQPVQRLPRYQLLLKELIKLSDEQHVDRKNLQEAMQKITAVNVEINKRKKEIDNTARINAIKREINGLDGELLVPNRLFIRSGAASLTSQKTKSIHAQIYLFNDVVIIAKMKKDSPPPYDFQERIEMAKIEVQDVDKKTIKLFDGSSEKLKLEWSLEFESEDIKKAWLKDVRESLETFQLRSLLDDNIQKTNLIKEGLLILSATFGVLSDPKRCIDVTQALQNVVANSGGAMLVLPAGPKSSMPGFINPAKGKSKQLMVVYSAKGVVRTKTWGEKDEVKINLTT